jgi:hypothetical protein
MGLFGSDTTKTYSTTNLTQEDKSVSAAGGAQNVLGSEAKLTQAAGSVLELPNAKVGDIVFEQFPEAVKSTIAGLIGNVNTTTQALGQTLAQQQLGGEAVLPKIVLYLVVGVGIIIIGSRVLKK